MKASTLKIVIFLITSLFYISNIRAQTNSNCPCCTTTLQQFDFWVGDWMVYDTTGNKVGENSISKIENNCALVEHWKGAQGGTGTSMNYYDKTDKTWNQLWIDSKGSILKLKGQLKAGKMVLRSELQKGQKIDWYYNQITWTPNKDGSVSQLWEVYNKQDQLLNTLFLGIYKKQ